MKIGGFVNIEFRVELGNLVHFLVDEKPLMAGIIDQESKYNLDHDRVLSERELETAMETEAKSKWRKTAELFMTCPPTYKRIMLFREIEQYMNTGTFQQSTIYNQV